MNRQDFVNSRRVGIGGSDVGSILQFDDAFKTPYETWYSKKFPTQDNDCFRFKMGRLLEPITIDLFKEKEGFEVQTNVPMFRHPEFDFLIGNVDGIIKGETDGILECKATTSFSMRNWIGEIPLQYYAQIQHYMYVAGLDYGYFAILCDGVGSFHSLRVERNEAYLNEVIPKLCEWWQRHVIDGNPPEITTLGDAKLAYAESIKDAIEQADDETFTTFLNLKETENQIKELSKQSDNFKLELQKKMKEKEFLVYDEKPLVTWKTNKAGKRTFLPKFN